MAAFARLVAEAPPELREFCAYTAQYATKHRDLIAQFGRFPHRNADAEARKHARRRGVA